MTTAGQRCARHVATRWAVGSVLLLGVLTVLVAGCSAAKRDRSSGTTAPSASSSNRGAGSSPAPSTAVRTAGPKLPSSSRQPSAGTSKVKRSGQPRTPSVTASSAPFSRGRKVSYPDGIALEITSITQGNVEGRGPGVISGPKTTFSIVFTNDSHRSIDMNQVVVTVTYGPNHLQARPVYDDTGEFDFAGLVPPGASRNATYAFSIPTDQLSRVVMDVDFDGLHTSAVFAGKVTTR